MHIQYIQVLFPKLSMEVGTSDQNVCFLHSTQHSKPKEGPTGPNGAYSYGVVCTQRLFSLFTHEYPYITYIDTMMSIKLHAVGNHFLANDFT